MASSSSAATKSIDVGSMFLMDLSIQESDPLNDSNGIGHRGDETSDNFIFPQYRKTLNNMSPMTSRQQLPQSSLETNRRQKRQLNANEDFGITDIGNDDYSTNQVDEDYLANSLERLASAIRNRDDQLEYQCMRNSNKRFNSNCGDDRQNLNLMTVAEPQPPPELMDPLSSSLSDESFVASSNTSLSASFIASSNGDNEDRGSTATREDSGVLDMRDLDNQSNIFERRSEEDHINVHYQRTLQEKPISMTAQNKVTNLITTTNNIATITDSSAQNYYQNDSYYVAGDSKNLNCSEPTNGKIITRNDGADAIDSNYHHHHNYHNTQSVKSRRSMSASLPIQVPARQMKKDLNKMKLIMNRNLAAGELELSNIDIVEEPTKRHGTNESIKDNNKSLSAKVADGFDEFLDQEYNENHQNHYPIDEHDDEHLRADENPMKLFASIQALAKSLHEDTELFGSLPPKRLHESPIRSLALA